MWPNLAKFYHFGKFLKVFGNYLRVYLVFVKILNLLLQKMWFGANFNCCKWPDIEIIKASGHTDGERERDRVSLSERDRKKRERVRDERTCG